jgi:SAM-dependent methyltransferase
MTEPDALKVRWDPDQYRRFASHRLRPALELIARLEGIEPATVYDLGCGTGEITRLLAARWPRARVHGVDSSEAMLEKARSLAGDGEAAPAVTFELGDLASWSAPEPAGVLYSNAAYHWIPNHRDVFPRLLRSLAPGCASSTRAAPTGERSIRSGGCSSTRGSDAAPDQDPAAPGSGSTPLCTLLSSGPMASAARATQANGTNANW